MFNLRNVCHQIIKEYKNKGNSIFEKFDRILIPVNAN